MNAPLSPAESSGTPPSAVVRVQIPDVAAPSREIADTTGDLGYQSIDRIDFLKQSVADSRGSTNASKPFAEIAADLTRVSPASNSDLSKLKHQPRNLAPVKIDRLIDSILEKFPLGAPVAIAFVGCKTDAETDKVAFDVAQRLTERRVGRVLLIDANANSQNLSIGLGLAKSEGLANVICDDQPWQARLQSGQVSGLDFLPHGNISTSKTLRSRTEQFLNDAKPYYQFVCASVGRNETPISKSFTNAVDGSYLLVDLKRVSQVEAKTVANKLQLNNQTLIGCIALDAELEKQ